MDEMRDLLEDYRGSGSPVVVRLTTGQVLTGPVSSVNKSTFTLDPEADDNMENIKDRKDWVGQFIMVRLDAVITCTWA
jgi:hypothetical protein